MNHAPSKYSIFYIVLLRVEMKNGIIKSLNKIKYKEGA